MSAEPRRRVAAGETQYRGSDGAVPFGVVVKYRCVVFSRDTSQTAALRHLELYRQAGAAGRTRIAAELSDAVRQTAIAGIKRRHPDYSFDQLAREFIAVVYGKRV